MSSRSEHERREAMGKLFGAKRRHGFHYEHAFGLCLCSMIKPRKPGFYPRIGTHQPFCTEVMHGIPGFEGLTRKQLFDHTVVFGLGQGQTPATRRAIVCEPYESYDFLKHELSVFTPAMAWLEWETWIAKPDSPLAMYNPGEATPVLFIHQSAESFSYKPIPEIRETIAELGGERIGGPPPVKEL